MYGAVGWGSAVLEDERLGGSPLTLVTIAAARSRSLTLRFCDAPRSRSNARVCVHRS